MQLGKAKTRKGWSGFGKFLPATFCQLFCCIRGLVGLFSIAVFNIVTNSSAYFFKLNVFNLHFGLKFYYKSLMNVICALCFAIFNFYYNGNVNLSMKSSD